MMPRGRLFLGLISLMTALRSTLQVSAFVHNSPTGLFQDMDKSIRGPRRGQQRIHQQQRHQQGLSHHRDRAKHCLSSWQDLRRPTFNVRFATDSSSSPSPPSTADSGAAGATPSVAVPPVGSVPSYQRLYDSAMGLLESELKLEPYPIPEGLEGNSAVVGKGRSQQSVETKIMAFKAPKFRQIRAALVETDGPTQVLNLVMFPDPSYDLPIFGADLVSLPGVHLICIDLQPAHGSQKLSVETDAALEQLQSRHAKELPWGGELPEAAQKYFSSRCIWSKLAPTEDVEEKALAAMMDYLTEYLNTVKDAEVVEGDDTLSKISEGHAEYSEYRRVNDPARGMLTRFYGAEWTEGAIEGILFDFKP